MGRPKLDPGKAGLPTVKKDSTGWVARAYYRDWTGRRVLIQRRGGTKLTAVENVNLAIAKTLLDLNPLAPVTRQTKLSKLAEMYLGELADKGLAAGTLRIYTSSIKKHLVSDTAPLHGVEVGDITPAKLNSALRMIAEGSGYGMAKTVHTIYRNVFELAISHEAILTNPAATAHIPKKPVVLNDDGENPFDKRVRALTEEEREVLLNLVTESAFAQSHQLVTLVHVLNGTGARIGEGCGMQWKFFNPEARELWVPGTKTESAPRNITIPKSLVDYLVARKAQIPHVTEEDWICPSPLGKKRDVSNTIRDLRDLFDSLKFEEEGKAPITFEWVTSHVFRKTVATRLDDAGLTPRQIADHLGHADPAMTMGRYMDRRSTSVGGQHLEERQKKLV